jgi:hypothetical protein
MALIVKNNVSGELAGDITDVATSVTLVDATDFPDPGADHYFATISTSDETDWEIVKVTAKATNTLTIERGQESAADSRLAARAWSTGDKIELRLTAGMFGKADEPVAISDTTPAETRPFWFKSDTGQLFVSYGGTYVEPAAGTGIAPPPSDGNYYAFKDGAWVPITTKITDP